MASQGNRSALTLLAAGILGAFAASACGSSPALAPGPDAGAGAGGAMGNAIRYVFVIAMENADAETVYDSADWSYLDSVLLPQAARAEAFQDELPIGLPSEPHYVWMEAGKNVFADHTFTTDDAPSASNSTADPNHLVAQLAQAEHGGDWMSYQEGLDAVTGACPLAGSGFYRPNHDPFVFFRDVAGTPPSTGAATCVAHHRPLSALTADLAAGSVSAYIFITPNLCHNGHGQSDCPDANAQQSADQWLSEALPPLIAFAGAHDGAIFLVWDEGNSGRVLPFVAIGPNVKAGYASSVTYSHGSLLKSLEEIFALPILPAVTTASDFADLFQPGSFP
jgi:hypothetical protein